MAALTLYTEIYALAHPKSTGTAGWGLKFDKCWKTLVLPTQKLNNNIDISEYINTEIDINFCINILT